MSISIITNFACCGLAEIDGVEDEVLNKKEFLSSFYGLTFPAYYVFTTRTTFRSNGTSLARLIRRHKYGTVKYIGTRLNMNSGNNLCMWVWAPSKSFRTAVYERLQKSKRESWL